MKILILTISIMILSSLSNLVGAQSLENERTFQGLDRQRQPCTLRVGPAYMGTNGQWQISRIEMNISGRQYILAQSNLKSGVFVPATNKMVGNGYLEHIVVVSSEVLGVGYEEAIDLQFEVTLDRNLAVTGYTAKTQKVRNELILGRWVEKSRQDLGSQSCGR